MKKKCVNVEGMLKGGPYSQAVEVGGVVYLSGVVPIDTAKGLFILDDIKAATTLVLDNIKLILAEAGSSLDKAVKVTIFLRDMADFPALNEVYETYFVENQPARTCVEVKGIPGNFPLEIEMIAVK